MIKEQIINNFVRIFRFWLIIRPTDLKKEFLSSIQNCEIKPEFENEEFWKIIDEAIKLIVKNNQNYEMISDVVLIKEIEFFLNKKADFRI